MENFNKNIGIASKIKSSLDEKYHNLVDTDIYKINTYLNIQNNVKAKNVIDNIVYLNEYYNDVPYYKNIIPKINKIKLPYTSLESDIDIDFSLLEYIKYTKNIVPILIWPTIASNTFFNNKKSKPFLDFLNKNGTIIIKKIIKITKKQAESFVFQIYSNINHFKIYSNLLESLKLKDFKRNEDNTIIVIYWIPKKNNTDYFGNSNSNKQELRKLLIDQYNINETIHICNSELQTIELSQLIFNKNSLEFMKYQRMDILIGKYRKFAKSIILINLFKKILYNNYQLIDINRFLAFSSIVLFALGLRNMNDIDAFFYHYPDFISSHTKLLKSKIDSFISENLGGPARQAIEFTCKGYGNWDFKNYKEYPHKWFEETLPTLYQANTYQNVIFNPRFHFYFLGIKCVLYKGDFARRAARNRPASIADLIAINRMTLLNVKIPPLPKKIWVNHKEVNIDQSEKDNIIRKVKKYLEYRYSIFIDNKEIQNLID